MTTRIKILDERAEHVVREYEITNAIEARAYAYAYLRGALLLWREDPDSAFRRDNLLDALDHTERVMALAHGDDS